MSSTKTKSQVVLEQASQQFVDATAVPPFLYELTPGEARKVLDDVQAAPHRQARGRAALDDCPRRGR
jgi:hypothetical protein